MILELGSASSACGIVSWIDRTESVSSSWGGRVYTLIPRERSDGATDMAIDELVSKKTCTVLSP